ncbi:MAG: ubiquinone/menaquinone biosynthesis methyltransferase [Desulfohalobiaceae bacterium]
MTAPADSSTQKAHATDPRQGMFASIAPWYDFLNRTLSLGLDLYWRRRLIQALDPGPGESILDLAAGTLDVSLGLLRQEPGCRVWAADISLPMLLRGQKKLRGRQGSLQGICSDAKNIPLPRESMHKAGIAFGIRNIQPRQQAYAQILQILKPGGRLAVLEFGSGRARIWRGLYNLYLQRVLPWVGRVVSKDPQAYSYLARSILEFPSALELAAELQEAGFCDISHQALTSGIVNIHLAHKPESAPPGRRRPV